MNLRNLKCEACTIDAPLVSDSEAKVLLAELDGWKIKSFKDINQLVKKFKFSNYAESIKFSNKVSALAESEDHHPKIILEYIENAGAIFLGKWTPEAVGDYIAGPNHTLPTSGNSRFSGSLGVETFMKNTSIIEFNEESLKINSLDIINLAKSEGLHSHANSVEIRFKD